MYQNHIHNPNNQSVQRPTVFKLHQGYYLITIYPSLNTFVAIQKEPGSLYWRIWRRNEKGHSFLSAFKAEYGIESVAEHLELTQV